MTTDWSGFNSATVNPENPTPQGVFSNPVYGSAGLGNNTSSAAAAGNDLVDLKLNLPLENPLSSYDTYNYVLTLASITQNMVNDPAGTYMSGKSPTIICKSAGANPDNRVQTVYGKGEFYIDNLEIDGMMGFTGGFNTNVFSVKFDVFEPYSIGLLFSALQEASFVNGHGENFRHAPYLLKIEFRGNNGGIISGNIPNTTKYIPIRINTIEMSADTSGAHYSVSATTISSYSQTIVQTKVPKDFSISGTTVQEALQSLETSLQFQLNQIREKEAKRASASPDQILILFPTSLVNASAGNKGSGTVPVYDTLGTSKVEVKSQAVSSSTTLSNQIQQTEINAIGKASLSFSNTRSGDHNVMPYSDVYKSSERKNRAAIQIDESSSTFKFPQGGDIISIINEVILNSQYANDALQTNAMDNFGFRTWWRIDTQVYYLGPTNEKTTNKPAMLTVFRVVPYKVHNSKFPSPDDKKPYRLQELAKKQISKVYHYIYTGKNTEIINFDIKFKFGFFISLDADKGNRSQDYIMSHQNGRIDDEKSKEVEPFSTQPEPSNPAEKPLPGSAGSVSYAIQNTESTTNGGSTGDAPWVRTARAYHDALTNENDMLELDMKVIGDPFWISSSGMGNYVVKGIADCNNVLSDFTVNWLTGEVFIAVEFKSPVDINDSQGLYTFNKNLYSPTIAFRGIYRVWKVTSTFKDGLFTQQIKGTRLNKQESKKFEFPDDTYSNTEIKDKNKG